MRWGPAASRWGRRRAFVRFTPTTLSCFTHSLELILASASPAPAQLLHWVAHMVRTLSLDGLRVDTATEVARPFWRAFSDAAGVFTLGEAWFACGCRAAGPTRGRAGADTPGCIVGPGRGALRPITILEAACCARRAPPLAQPHTRHLAPHRSPIMSSPPPTSTRQGPLSRQLCRRRRAGLGAVISYVRRPEGRVWRRPGHAAVSRHALARPAGARLTWHARLKTGEGGGRSGGAARRFAQRPPRTHLLIYLISHGPHACAGC